MYLLCVHYKCNMCISSSSTRPHLGWYTVQELMMRVDWVFLFLGGRGSRVLSNLTNKKHLDIKLWHWKHELSGDSLVQIWKNLLSQSYTAEEVMGSIVIDSSWAMFLDLEMVKKMSPLSSQSHPGMGRTPLMSVNFFFSCPSKCIFPRG